MGDYYLDAEAYVNREDTVGVTYGLRYHFGQQGIDERRDCSRDQFRALVQSSGQQSAFDATATQVFGTWYVNKPQAFKAQARLAFEDLRTL